MRLSARGSSIRTHRRERAGRTLAPRLAGTRAGGEESADMSVFINDLDVVDHQMQPPNHLPNL